MVSEWYDTYDDLYSDDSELPDIANCTIGDDFIYDFYFSGGVFTCSCGGVVEDFVCTKCHTFFVEEYVEHQYKEKQRSNIDYDQEY